MRRARKPRSRRAFALRLPGTTTTTRRLVFGPDERLYYTIGDQGANQYDNKCVPNRAQALPSQREVDAGDWSTYRGKILRVALDGSIPSDNPALDGVRSHIYSYGHRNPQGLAFDSSGRLYSSEHGPRRTTRSTASAGWNTGGRR